nr:MAG TPA: hypothetical protein [Caudoviricetes sp.]
MIRYKIRLRFRCQILIAYLIPSLIPLSFSSRFKFYQTSLNQSITCCLH